MQARRLKCILLILDMVEESEWATKKHSPQILKIAPFQEEHLYQPASRIHKNQNAFRVPSIVFIVPSI